MNFKKNIAMKRTLLILVAAVMGTVVCHAAMSNSRVRKETRFLTDKMAYELNLNTEQYNDVYEINYDFISGVRYLMDDVMRGQEWALNRYYDYLDVRNDDLRWVLSSRQYSRFMQAAYFFRPIYVSGGRWSFRIYVTYTNSNHFYYPRPYHYRTYCGGHYRTHYHNASYYRGRYNHPAYNGSFRIRNDKSYHASRRSDFGPVHIRPNSGTHPNPGTKPNPGMKPDPHKRPNPNARPASNARPGSNARPSSGTRTETGTRPETGQSGRRSSAGSSTRRSGTKKEVSTSTRGRSTERSAGSSRRN